MRYKLREDQENFNRTVITMMCRQFVIYAGWTPNDSERVFSMSDCDMSHVSRFDINVRTSYSYIERGIRRTFASRPLFNWNYLARPLHEL